MTSSDGGGPVFAGFIFIRDYSDTHIARFQGKTASCTGGRKLAAEAVARKVMGKKQHTIEMCGNEYLWKVLLLEEGG